MNGSRILGGMLTGCFLLGWLLIKWAFLLCWLIGKGMYLLCSHAIRIAIDWHINRTNVQ